MMHLFKRTAAYCIDCTLVFSVVMLVIQWGILSNIRDSIGITDEWFTSSIHMQLYVLTTISIPVWAYFTYFDSNKSNGTFGKRILKLLVTDNDDQKISIGKAFLRTFFKLLPWEIAHIGVIFPTPLYFASEPDVRLLSYVGILLFIIYVTSILINTSNQSIYDKFLGTYVSKSNWLRYNP